MHCSWMDEEHAHYLSFLVELAPRRLDGWPLFELVPALCRVPCPLRFVALFPMERAKLQHKETVGKETTSHRTAAACARFLLYSPFLAPACRVHADGGLCC
jgi:hypothetical protein